MSRLFRAEERLVWLLSACLAMAWVFFLWVWFAMYHDSWHPQAGWQGLALDVEWGGSNRSLVVAGVFGVGVLGLAALFYRLGAAEIRRQMELERQLRQALQGAYVGTLSALAAVLDLHDEETYGHSQRVMRYSLAIARRLSLSLEEQQTLAWGALIHDLGKIGIPDHILRKPGPLNDEEWAEMRRHVLIGDDLVRRIPFLRATAPIVRHHHERYDGRGYPDGLAGEAIPLLARIFTVADALDAMTSSRPYRPVPLSVAAAVAEIAAEAGRQFCPRVVAALESIPLAELEAIRTEPVLSAADLSSLISLDGIAGSEAFELDDPLPLDPFEALLPIRTPRTREASGPATAATSTRRR